MQEKIVGERIKTVRKFFKISSQEVFAEKFNVAVRTLRNYECGHTPIPHSFLSQLMDEFDISVDWLLTGEGEMKRPTKDSASIKLNPTLQKKIEEKAEKFGMELKQYIEFLMMEDIKNDK